MYVASIYCKFDEQITPYLGFLGELAEVARGEALLVGMDANVISPMCYSKMSRHSSGYASYHRGEELSEFLLHASLGVANVPIVEYTFHTENGESDIDVTVINYRLSRDFIVEWKIKSDVSISDHNTIFLVLSRETADTTYSAPAMWSVSGVDWDCYSERVCHMLREFLPWNVFSELSIDEKLDRLTEVVKQIYLKKPNH